MLTIEEFAFNLINVFESCKLSAYRDLVGIWTIGYGHTPAREGDVITKEQALDYFKSDCKSLFDRVRSIPLLEASAWVSFGYNLGIHTMEKVLTEGDVDKILLYDKAGTQHYRIPGLTSRRSLEHSLILVSRG